MSILVKRGEGGENGRDCNENAILNSILSMTGKVKMSYILVKKVAE